MLLKVTGMTCGHCVKAVTKALQALDARAEVVVDLGHGHVRASGSFSAGQAISALAAEGYVATETAE
ncbi:MAG: cation transporter [Thermomonas sp.]|uniref:heavy-metal-associated domain-containing protein n=1 Tax=Thermomonas sp. TaxID=1971895 RepID=UPI0039E3A0CF